MTDKKIMTIQDISCYGQCSLTVALPILSACGVETAVLPSAVLSTHTGGFSGYTFRDLTNDIPGIMKHWVSEKIEFDCVYTGYLGSIIQIEYVKEIFHNVLKPDGLKIVDPAMADNGKLYNGFNLEYVRAMAGLCSQADIILPNITEACLMCGIEYRPDCHDKKYITKLLNALISLGAKRIVLKGVSYEEGKLGISVLDTESGERHEYFNDKVEKFFHGTGDCYASALTGAIIQGKSLFDAAVLAANFVVECLKLTVDDDNHRYGVKFEKALPILVNSLNK